MVFTDTVNFLNFNMIPITQLAFAKDSKRMATLSQDNNIKIWKVLHFYKWESKLVSQVESESYLYQEDTLSFKPLFVIDNTSMNATINKIGFSNLKHKIHEPKPAPKSGRKSEVTVKSKNNPEKSIKVSIIQSKEEENLQNTEPYQDFLLVVGDDNGVVTFFKNQAYEQKWAKFYEFSVGDFAPITDLAWHSADEFLAIATFSLEVKLYKMNFASKPYHHLQRTIKSESGQIFQVLWNPQASDLFAIHGKGHISVWDLNSEKMLGSCKEEKVNRRKSVGVVKQASEENKKMEQEDAKEEDEEGEDVDLKELIDKHFEDSVVCFKNYTCWVNETGFLGVWNKKNTSDKNGKSPHKETTGSQWKFHPVQTNDLICFKVSPGEYWNAEKSQSYHIGLIYNGKEIRLVSLDSENCAEVEGSCAIRELKNKTFTDFEWLDCYRFLAIDDMGRVHFFFINEDELGKLAPKKWLETSICL